MPSLERVGESTELGELLLGMLRLAGWTVAQVPAFGGGVLVEAARGNRRVRAAGASIGDVASVVLREALTR